MNSKCKVIVLSTLNGKFNKVVDIYNKIASKSGQFDLVILIGNVFSQSESFSGLNQLKELSTHIVIFDSSPISTLLKAKIAYEPYYYADNIVLLGTSGIYTFNSSIKIAFLNGIENSFFMSKQATYYSGNAFTYDDLSSLMNNNDHVKQVDILLLSSMPQLLYQELQNDFSSPYHNASLQLNKDTLALSISYTGNLLLKKLMPRYLICSLDDFYFERKPYLNSEGFLTRFIHLGYFDNKINPQEKYVYAINIKPITSLSKEEMNQLDNLIETSYTQTPFSDDNVANDIESVLSVQSKYKGQNVMVVNDELYIGNLDRYLNYEELKDFLSSFGEVDSINMNYDRKKFSGFAYVKFKDKRVYLDLLNNEKAYTLKGKKVIIKERVIKMPSLEEIEKTCWFCLNNSMIDRGLILKTFSNFYIAYSKGPIDNMHLLLLPNKHVQSIAEMDMQLRKEYNDILTTIKQFVSDNGLECIVYEKNLPYKQLNARHMVTHLVGVSLQKCYHFIEASLEYFKENKIKFNTVYDESFIMALDTNEFYYFINSANGIKINKTPQRVTFLVKVEESTKDFIDHSRNIICNIIEKDSVDWKNCKINQEFFNKLKEKMNKYYID